jgi:hypothetical protein
MRHLAIAVLLACMLSGTARAGEVPSTGVVAPQPSSSAGATGAIQTTDVTSPQESITVLMIILTVLGIVR